MHKYIFKGKTHTNISVSYMQNLGMTKEQQDSVLQQAEFECNQVNELRRNAYITESDPLYIEWQFELNNVNADADSFKQAWIDKVAEIKVRFPHIPTPTCI